ncbi:MAG: VWA domain-containing protein [Clostridia bacterium]
MDLVKLVADYALYADTSSLMCENAYNFFMINLLSELKRQNKCLTIISNVRGELNGLLKDAQKNQNAKNGLDIISAYKSYNIINEVTYKDKVFADRAFLNIFIELRLNENICLITEDRKLAKDVTILLNNIDSAPTEFDLKCLRLCYGEPKFWDNSQIESQLGLNEIDDYRIMNENINHKLLVSFVIDNSASMLGEKMDAFNKAFFEFTDRLYTQDEDNNVEYAINIFDGFEPRQIKGYSDKIYNRASMVAGRLPFLGKSLNKSVNNLVKHMSELDASKQSYYKPWIVLLSDGQSFDNVEQQMNVIKQMNEEKKIVFLPFLLSDSSISQELDSFVHFKGKRPLQVTNMKYKEMFDWLYLTMAKRLKTSLSNHFVIDKDGIKGWTK